MATTSNNKSNEDAAELNKDLSSRSGGGSHGVENRHSAQPHSDPHHGAFWNDDAKKDSAVPSLQHLAVTTAARKTGRAEEPSLRQAAPNGQHVRSVKLDQEDDHLVRNNNRSAGGGGPLIHQQGVELSNNLILPATDQQQKADGNYDGLLLTDDDRPTDQEPQQEQQQAEEEEPDTRATSRQEEEEEDSLAIPEREELDDSRGGTLPTPTREQHDAGADATLRMTTAEATIVATTSLLIQAHLAEDSCTSTTPTQTMDGENSSNDADDTDGRNTTPAVEAKTLDVSAIPQLKRSICILLVISTLLIVGVIIVSSLVATNAAMRRGVNASSSAAAGDKALGGRPGDSRPLAPTTMNDSSKGLLPTQSPAPSASPTLSFESHVLSLLPPYAREAVAVPLSPQHHAFNLLVYYALGLAEIPADQTLLNMFGFKVFYFTTNVKHWLPFVPPSNTSTFDACKYPFAECDVETQTFTTLEFPSYGIEGYIPPELSLVGNMTILNLAHNFLRQELPGELSLLQKLHHLEFSHNLLEGVSPRLMSDSPSLVTVLLDHNVMHGTLAPEWARLNRTLEVLSLHSNQFEGTIPAAWSALTNLKQLSLHDNPGLSGSVPAGLCDMVRMGRLNLTLDCALVSCGTCGCQCADRN